LVRGARRRFVAALEKKEHLGDRAYRAYRAYPLPLILVDSSWPLSTAFFSLDNEKLVENGST
jgi:hypothetical protein